MEPYLYCGICFKDGKERALFLTSCAHVLCQEHVNLNEKRCVKCHVRDISIVKIENAIEEMPESIRDIIEPSFEKLSNIQFANKFQYVQMKDKIYHYEKENKNLKDKNGRLKELLKKSRIELDKCNEYQKEIVRLREEKNRLTLKLQIGENTNTSGGSHGKRSVDELQEITMEEYCISREGNDRKSEREKKGDDFMNKMRRFSQLSGRTSRTSSISSGGGSGNSGGMRGKELIGSFNIEAESTGMNFRKSTERSSSLQMHKKSSGMSTRGMPATATTTATTRTTATASKLSKFSFKPPSLVGVAGSRSGISASASASSSSARGRGSWK